jgi:hypothetical protein
MHISFSAIYLLQEKRLNTRNYSNHGLIMEKNLLTTDNDMNMHAKIQIISKYKYF